MTDSTRFSAPAGHPTPVEDGTPAGLPTPAGEPSEQMAIDLFSETTKSSASEANQPSGDVVDDIVASDAVDSVAEDPEIDSAEADANGAAVPANDIDEAARRAIGGIVMAWGALEAATAHKLVAMRRIFGDVRALGGRSRPSLQLLLAELRALVALRDRHDKHALSVIAGLESDLQRLAQFRSMIVEGTQRLEVDQLICLDHKNADHAVPVASIFDETARIDDITQKIAAL